MNPEEIRSLLRKQPFEPFRIYLTDGKQYEVRVPDMILVTLRTTHIGIARNTTSDMYDAADLVANRHITRLEPIVPETAAS